MHLWDVTAEFMDGLRLPLRGNFRIPSRHLPHVAQILAKLILARMEKTCTKEFLDWVHESFWIGFMRSCTHSLIHLLTHSLASTLTCTHVYFAHNSCIHLAFFRELDCSKTLVFRVLLSLANHDEPSESASRLSIIA